MKLCHTFMGFICFEMLWWTLLLSCSVNWVLTIRTGGRGSVFYTKWHSSLQSPVPRYLESTCVPLCHLPSGFPSRLEAVSPWRSPLGSLLLPSLRPPEAQVQSICSGPSEEGQFPSEFWLCSLEITQTLPPHWGRKRFKTKNFILYSSWKRFSSGVLGSWSTA